MMIDKITVVPYDTTMIKSTRTYSAKAHELESTKLLINAKGLVVGRLAAIVSTLLRGKHKPKYTPHLNCGDSVIVINAKDMVLTGNKLTKKNYYRHSGYPGGIKQTTPEKLLARGLSKRILESAVKGMLPRGPLGRAQLKKLRVYEDDDHPHEAQKPQQLDVAAMNSKNAPSQ